MADALRAEIVSFTDLPATAREVLGGASREWIDTMITGVIEESLVRVAAEPPPRDCGL